MMIEELVLLLLELNPEPVLLALGATPGRNGPRMMPLVDLLLQLGHRSVDDFLPELLRA